MAARHYLDGHPVLGQLGPAEGGIEGAEKRMDLGAEESHMTGVRLGQVVAQVANVDVPELAFIFGVSREVQPVPGFDFWRSRPQPGLLAE